jgi:hypothetical protein
MKKAQKGVTQTKRFASKRSDSYPVEEKVEYDTTGYSSGKKMFPAKFTKTYASGKVETNTGSGDRGSVDKAIKNPVTYSGTRTQYTKLPATGSDIRKYMYKKPTAPLKGPLTESTASKSTPAKTTAKTNTKAESPKTSGGVKKSTAPAKKKIVRTKSEPIPGEKAIAAAKEQRKNYISSVNVKAPTKGIDKGPEKRKFTDAQIKIMEVMKKGQKADGTMKEGAQRKIQAIRTKERLAKQKIRNKAERAEKRYEVKSAKAKVKSVRKSFKK